MAEQESPPTELIVLRFPNHIRRYAGFSESQESTPPTTHSPPPTPPKRSRWGLRLFLFVLGLSMGVFAAVVYLLEQDYLIHSTQEQQLALLGTKLQDIQQHLQPKQVSRQYLSLPRYLEHLDQVFKKLQQHHKQFCSPSSTQGASKVVWKWPQNRQEWVVLGQTLREELWRTLHPTYIRVRRTFTHTPPLQGQAQQTKLCQTVPQQLLGQLRNLLHQSSQRLVTEAKRHLQWYGWCQTEWAIHLEHPKHRGWLQNMQRDTRCQRECRKRTSDACQSCLGQWRNTLRLSEDTFQQYHHWLREADKRRCISWFKKSKHDAHQGIFHWGEYFWRVQRVLSYQTWLQQHQLCDSICQQYQKDWGFQLRLDSEYPKATVHVRLWPEHVKAPTSWLRQIAQTSLGHADGQPIWIPALRQDLLSTPLPTNHWMLLLINDVKTNQSTFLPLAPEAGRQLQLSLSLTSLKIYNDGRQPVRFPSLSPQEDWLAFVTYQSTSNTKAFAFTESFCWQWTDQGTSVMPSAPPGAWRSAIRIHAVSDQGQPVQQGHYWMTPALVSQVQFSPVSGALDLWVSSDRRPDSLSSVTSGESNHHVDSNSPSSPPNTFTPPPPTTESAGASLWQLGFQPNQTTAFVHPVPLSQAPDRSVDLPFPKSPSQLAVLRLRCPLPTSLSLLQKSTDIPDMIPLPQGFRILHGVSSPTEVAFLLQHQDENYPSLWKLRRSLFSSPTPTLSPPQKLRAAFRQMAQHRSWIIVAGGQPEDPVLAVSEQQTISLLAGQPHVRYLDPVVHRKSRRLFVIQQWSIPGSVSWKPMTSFLVSVPVPPAFFETKNLPQE